MLTAALGGKGRQSPHTRASPEVHCFLLPRPPTEHLPTSPNSQPRHCTALHRMHSTTAHCKPRPSSTRYIFRTKYHAMPLSVAREADEAVFRAGDSAFSDFLFSFCSFCILFCYFVFLVTLAGRAQQNNPSRVSQSKSRETRGEEVM